MAFLHFPARGGRRSWTRPADLACLTYLVHSFQLLAAHHATVGCFCWAWARAVTPPAAT